MKTLTSIIFIIIAGEAFIALFLYLVYKSPILSLQFEIKFLKKIFSSCTNLNKQFIEKRKENDILGVVFLVFSLVIFILSFFPNILDFKKILVGGTETEISPIFFNLVVAVIPIIFAAYFNITKSILKSPFQKHFEGIDYRHSVEKYGKGFKTTKIYVLESLSSLEKIMADINSEIVNQRIDDVSGWSKNEPRKEKLLEFLEINNQVQKDFIFLDKYRDYHKNIFKDMYLDVYDKTHKNFISKISRLADSQGNQVLIPEFAADLILENAIKIPNVRGQYATSLLDFNTFYIFYKNFNIANLSKSCDTQRIFLLDTSKLWEEFKEDVEKIKNNRDEDLPRGLNNIFSKDFAIPKIFWVIEWHMQNYWQILFAKKNEATKLYKEFLKKPPYLDFIIIDMKGYDLVFSSDIENPQKHFLYNIEINCYQLLAMREENNFRISYDFFNKLKGISKSMEKSLIDYEEENLYNEVICTDIQRNNIALRNVIEMLKERTAKDEWIRKSV